MAMVVKNNLAAVRTLNILNGNSSALNKSLARVSSGMKITGAQDDAAGYAISERMRVRIRALDQANQNTQNDSSLMKTAEGAVGNTVEILRALKEKAINSANDANTDEDRQTIQKEINQFIDQIDDNALVTFNGKYLVDGSKNNAATATKTILLNQSLKVGTLSTDALTDLSNRAGDSLGIQSTDYYQVSWVENGTIHTTSGQVGTNSLDSILTQDGLNGVVRETDQTVTGLIGTDKTPAAPTPDPLEGYSEVQDATTSDAASVTAGIIEDDTVGDTSGLQKLQTMFAGDTTVAALTNSQGIQDLRDADGNKYYMQVEDGADPVEVTINITYHSDIEDTNGSATKTGYEVSITDADGNPLVDSDGNEIAVADIADKKLYTKDAPTPPSTYGTTDGTLVEPAQMTYTDATTSAEAALQIPAADQSGTNADTEAAKWTDILGWDGTKIGTNNAEISGTLTGVYTKSQDADGNDVYTKVDDIKVSYTRGTSATSASLTFTSSDGAASTPAAVRGADLYILDMDDPQNIKTLAETGLDNLPATITKAAEEKEEATTPTVVDKFKKAVYTPDKTDGIAFIANEPGVDNQISGLTISIIDQDHNVKKAANAALDQFKQYQRAENQTGDMALNFHIGSEANQAIKVGLGDMRAQALGLKGSNGERIDVFTKDNANAAINAIENALTKALDQQTTIGAIEARLEYTSTNLTTSSENVQAAESTIRDADMAKEMTNYTKANVLLQAAQAMLAQANQSSSGVLSLLQ